MKPTGSTRSHSYRGLVVSRSAIVRALVEIGRRQRAGPWPSGEGISLAGLLHRLGLAPPSATGSGAPAAAQVR